MLSTAYAISWKKNETIKIWTTDDFAMLDVPLWDRYFSTAIFFFAVYHTQAMHIWHIFLVYIFYFKCKEKLAESYECLPPWNL